MSSSLSNTNNINQRNFVFYVFQKHSNSFQNVFQIIQQQVFFKIFSEWEKVQEI